MDYFWAIPSHERSTPEWKKAHDHVSYVWPACGTPSLPVWNINMVAIYEKCPKIGQNSMKKWPFFANILPWMARYGSKRGFLLILSARDDLVKVSWKSDAGKCQNQLTPPYFDQLSERHQPLCKVSSSWSPILSAISKLFVCKEIFRGRVASGREFTNRIWWALTKLCAYEGFYGFYTWSESKISLLSPFIIGSKLTFTGCSGRWLPYAAMFIVTSNTIYMYII